MIYSLTGIFLAALLGVVALVLLGPAVFAQQQWLEPMFWLLFGTGIGLNAIDNVLSVQSISCWFSRKVDDFLVRWLHTSHHCLSYICHCDDQTKGIA